MNLIYFSVQNITSIFVSGFAVILFLAIILIFVVIARKSSGIKKMNELTAKINTMEFSDLMDNEKEFSCFTYNDDFLKKSKLKDTLVPPQKIFSGQIVFNELLDFKKLYFDAVYQPIEKKLKFSIDAIIFNQNSYDLRQLISVSGMYEAKKNAIFLNFIFFDEKSNFCVQIVDYEVLAILENTWKKFRMRP